MKFEGGKGPSVDDRHDGSNPSVLQYSHGGSHFGILFAHSDRHPKRQDGRQDVKANPRQVQGNYHGCDRYIRATGIYDARAVQSQQNVHEASPASRTSVHHRSYHHNGACGVAVSTLLFKSTQKENRGLLDGGIRVERVEQVAVFRIRERMRHMQALQKYEHQNPQGGMKPRAYAFLSVMMGNSVASSPHHQRQPWKILGMLTIRSRTVLCRSCNVE